MPDLVSDFQYAFAETIVRRSKEIGADVWPAPIVNPFDINKITHEYILAQLENAIDLIWATYRDPAAAIGAESPFPSRLAQLMYLFMESPRDDEQGERRYRLASRMLEVISWSRGGDPFCRAGNRIVNRRSLVYKFASYERADLQTTAAHLSFLLSTVAELNYLALVAIAREISGPFPDPSGGIRFDTIFHDLNPDYVRDVALPFSDVTFSTLHPPISVQFDFIGRVYEPIDFQSSALGLALEVDGIPIEERRLVSKLSELIAVTTDYLHRRMQDPHLTERGALMAQWGQAQQWAIRPLLRLAGLDTAASSEMIARLAQGERGRSLLIDALRAAPAEEDLHISHMASLLDPRNPRKLDPYTRAPVGLDDISQ